MNRTDKPKLTSHQIIEMMKNEKGITFLNTSEEDAEKYLEDVNNYLRTASYRKNYQKYLNGNSKGKYIDLDFSYLQELSTIDMHLRNLITKMCIDIEHDLKVALLKDLENNSSEDGYSIVDSFLNANPYIVHRIEATSSSPFTCNLIHKYFDIQSVFNPQKNKYENKIRGIDCPVWVLLELLTFGDFICFYEYYYATKGQVPISTSLINLVKSLRNGCAHNNCIIADLNPGASKTPPEISASITGMSDITKSQRKKKLSCRVILEFVCMLHIYDQVVSVNVKNKRVTELKDLFTERVIEKGIYFEKNQLITSSYDFVKKVIDNLFG